MGGLFKAVGAKWQIDTLLGKTSDGPGQFANIRDGGGRMSKVQRKAFLEREAAKPGSGTNTPLTDRYS